MNYVYWRSEPNLFTVGFYRDDDGEWETDSDWSTREEASKRVHYLNGGVSEEIKLYKHVTDGGAIYLTTRENDLSTAIVRLDGEPVLLPGRI